ncbi:hypothetical protein C8R46DRAFT_928733, partial [Mycena filopes]
GLLEVYCPAAAATLDAQKRAVLSRDPTALYPSDASLYSAITVELGGAHHCQPVPGTPDQHQANTWSLLTALGNYNPLHGGHLIVWDLGLVICFPPGATILIPSALLRYSFVKVRSHETRYSVLQWAAAGIFRWFRNGKRTDLDFAVHATRPEHQAREEAVAAALATALDQFPLGEELPDSEVTVPFVGTYDPAEACWGPAPKKKLRASKK